MKTLTYKILRKLPVSERLKAHFLNHYGLGGRVEREPYLTILLAEDKALAREFAILFELSAHIIVTYPSLKKIYQQIIIKDGKEIYQARYDKIGQVIPEQKEKLF